MSPEPPKAGSRRAEKLATARGHRRIDLDLDYFTATLLNEPGTLDLLSDVETDLRGKTLVQFHRYQALIIRPVGPGSQYGLLKCSSRFVVECVEGTGTAKAADIVIGGKGSG